MGAGGSTPVEIGFYKRLAYQVVHVVKDSPADEAGLKPYFDFITALPPVQTFPNSCLPYDEYVRDSLAKHPTIELTVFNCATGCVRRTTFSQRRYGRERLDLTGFIVRPVIISDAMLEVEHVQEVHAGSSAHQAGLVPNLDYVIATDEGNCFDLHHITRVHNPADYVQIYVFDIFVQTSRVVQIPADCKSRFGCTLASGYLHRVPQLQKLTFYLRKQHFEQSRQLSATTTSSSSDLHSIESSPLIVHSPLQPSRPVIEPTELEPKPTSDETDRPKSQETTEDCCTIVTRIRLNQVLDDVDENAELPVSVNLPKDILRDVISEMVRYEQEQLNDRVAISTNSSSIEDAEGNLKSKQSSTHTSVLPSNGHCIIDS